MTGTSVGTGWDVAMGEAMWVLMLGSPCCGVGRNVSSCPTAGVPRGSHPPCPILGSKWKLISSVGAHALGLGGEGFLHSTEGALGFPLCFVASFPGLKCLAEAKQGGSGLRPASTWGSRTSNSGVISASLLGGGSGSVGCSLPQ